MDFFSKEDCDYYISVIVPKYDTTTCEWDDFKNRLKVNAVFDKTFYWRKELENAKPKDLMPVLSEKVFFNKDHRNGLPLRNVLRELDDNDFLYLLPQISVERKDKNRYWFFNAL